MDFFNRFAEFGLSNPNLHPTYELTSSLGIIKMVIATIGTLIILSGVVYSAYRFIYIQLAPKKALQLGWDVDFVRRELGKVIVLGLEFIVAADVVATTSAPDYYSVGILAIVVLIRTFLSYSLSREINLTPNK